jgi:hypothetical protein
MESWSVLLAVFLAAAVYALEWLRGVDPTDALVDAALTGFIIWVILKYWRR